MRSESPVEAEARAFERHQCDQCGLIGIGKDLLLDSIRSVYHSIQSRKDRLDEGVEEGMGEEGWAFHHGATVDFDQLFDGFNARHLRVVEGNDEIRADAVYDERMELELVEEQLALVVTWIEEIQPQKASFGLMCGLDGFGVDV